MKLASALLITSLALAVLPAAEAKPEAEKAQMPLIAAAEAGDMGKVKALLKTQDINAQNREGQTALMEAACEGHTEIVRLLLQAGADPNAQNREGQTALIEVSTRKRATTGSF